MTPVKLDGCNHDAWEQHGSWHKCADCGHVWSTPEARRDVPRPMTAPPVIVTVPSAVWIDDVEVCVRHEDWGVEVDVRPAGTSLSWMPIGLAGGAFCVRAA